MDAARRIDGGELTHELGVIERVEEELLVATSGGRYRARRAVGCLVAPEAGDLVSVAISAAGRAWVLNVLERGADTPIPVRFEGDVELAASGRLGVEAEGDVRIGSREKLHLVARALELKSLDVRALVERLGVVGRVAHVDLEEVKSVVRFVDQVLERISTTVKRSYRFVEEMDMTRAREVDLRAEKTIHVRSENAFVSAEKLVKVEGDQIHLG